MSRPHRISPDTPSLDRYIRYLRLFGLEGQDWSNLVVADFGCGPLGGMLNVVFPRRGYAIDLHAAEFPPASMPILGLDRRMRSPLPPHVCDVVFLLDVLDHTRVWWGILDEIGRIIRSDGLLYLFSHIHERRKPHVKTEPWRFYHFLGAHGIQVGTTQGQRPRPWTWLERHTGKDVVMDPFKRCFWGVLQRRVL